MEIQEYIEAHFRVHAQLGMLVDSAKESKVYGELYHELMKHAKFMETSILSLFFSPEQLSVLSHKGDLSIVSDFRDPKEWMVLVVPPFSKRITTCTRLHFKIVGGQAVFRSKGLCSKIDRDRVK